MYIVVMLVITIALIHADENPPDMSVIRNSTGYGCSTPIMEYEPYCGPLITKYYYNRTAQRCLSFRWNGCLRDGVYDTRIDCTYHCSPDEDASICEEPREGNCSKPQYPYKTQYFYNITSQTCETYNICTSVGVFPTVNSFNSKTLCVLQCGGFTLNNTKSGRSDGRQLLALLDTDQNIWITRRSYNNSSLVLSEFCIKYRKRTLEKSEIVGPYPYDYDYEFFYEWVTDQRTYQTRYYGHIAKYSKYYSEYMDYVTDDGRVKKELLYWSLKKKCAIMLASRNDRVSWCELHLWEERLRKSYQNKNYTDCREELSKHCPNNTEQEVLRADCPNVFFPGFRRVYL
nr:uncharacterized protein LOC119167960 isoform X1 [Rhipicephalus microplus]